MKKIIKIILIVLVVISAILALSKFYLNKDLNNESFKVVSWSSSSVSPDASNIILTFSNYTISGNGGVNAYSANMILGLNKRMRFNKLTTTEMASTDTEINKAESMYYSLLNLVRYYKLSSKELKLYDKNKNELMTLEIMK